MAGSTKSRKKTDKADAVTGKPNNTNEKSSTGNQPNMPLEDHLNRAEATIERNHAAMLDMHQQWRTQLLRMSYLIIIVTLHIAQTPSAACIKDIKVRTTPFKKQTKKTENECLIDVGCA